jgi:hypothetical protein
MKINDGAWAGAGGFAICLILLGVEFFSLIPTIRPIAIIGAIIFSLGSLTIGFFGSKPRVLAPVPLILAGAFALFGIYLVNSFWPG